MNHHSRGPRLRRRAFALAVVVPLLLGGAPVAHGAEPTDHRIKAITYNVGDGSDAAKRSDLRRLIAMKPHVIGLQEVADREGLVMAVAHNNGYRAIFEDASHHNAVLVRRTGTEVLGHGVTRISDRSRVSTRTPGSRDGWHPAKYVHWVRLRANGLTWVTGVVHLVPSASRFALNKELHNTQVAAAAAWFRSRTAEPLLMGDFNAEAGTGLMTKLREVARAWSRDSHGDRAIDQHWSKKDATGAVAALSDPDYSSDHRPVRVVLTVRR